MDSKKLGPCVHGAASQATELELLLAEAEARRAAQELEVRATRAAALAAVACPDSQQAVTALLTPAMAAPPGPSRPERRLTGSRGGALGVAR
jgi:hypothetical protein